MQKKCLYAVLLNANNIRLLTKCDAALLSFRYTSSIVKGGLIWNHEAWPITVVIAGGLVFSRGCSEIVFGEQSYPPGPLAMFQVELNGSLFKVCCD